MAFIDTIKERARADKKTIVLPESMDKRTYEAAVKIRDEGLANLIIIGTPEEIAKHGAGLICRASPLSTRLMTRTSRNTLTSSLSCAAPRA